MTDYMSMLEFTIPGAYLPYVAMIAFVVSLLVAVLWFYSGRYSEWAKTAKRKNLDALEEAKALGQTIDQVDLIDTDFTTRYKVLMFGSVAIAVPLSILVFIPTAVGYFGLYDAVLGAWIVMSMIVSAVVTIVCGYAALYFTVGWENENVKNPLIDKAIEAAKQALIKK
jgi:uncharacterized membrane protein